MSAVLLCVEGALATITLNRPAKLNAIDAEEALRLGLVDHVVPAADRAGAVEQVLATYLAAPRTATIAFKRLLARAFDPPVAEIAASGSALFHQCLAAPDVAAASAAWRRRRTEATG